MRKNTWYAVYHQRELDYLARSYQPGYFFILMGRKPLTEYLPIDGSKPMTGDLLASPSLTHNLGEAGAKWKEVNCGYSRPTYLMLTWVRCNLHPYIDNNYDIGSPTKRWKDIQFLGTMTAGNITGLAGKTLDFPLFKVGGVAGVDGTFTTVDGKTVTVSKGIITAIV